MTNFSFALLMSIQVLFLCRIASVLSLNCERSKCDYEAPLGNFSMQSIDALVDNHRKILMDWTPKAGCTAAVVMFLDHLGVKLGRDYDNWPHDYRSNTYNPKCGNAAACMYEDDSWYRFKVVRNPYTRLVSAYMYLMGRSVEIQQEHSFADVVHSLTKVSTEDMEMLLLRHLGYQHRPFERYFYEHNMTAYHEIVRIENYRSSLARINRHLNTTFHLQPTSQSFQHYARKHPKFNAHGFIGDQPWVNIMNRVPQNYGCFYNESLRAEVGRLFHWDLTLYNYRYPFPPCL